MQSPSQLLSGFCAKEWQTNAALEQILNTPTRQCAAFILCQQVGMTMGSPQACQQAGLRNQ